ncbi:MAG: NfeD family protein [Ignisphaera sp.]
MRITQNSSLLIILHIILAIYIPLLSIHTIYGSSNLNAVIVDFDINIDGGALVFWERILNSYRGNVLVLKINSYGGYLSVADRIVNDILERNIECYTWIPPGGYAVSAASMIALGCRGIYMGSGSVIGAATPSPSEPKVVEYVAARFRSLAERIFDREELVDIAEAMVREGRALTAEEAVSIGFAKRAESVKEIEDSIGIRVAYAVSPSQWDRLLSILSLPIVSNILLVAGLFLILAEIFTTGFQGYAIAGVLLILLALYSMNVVSPDLFALLVMLIGTILLAIEMYTPGFGLFGLTGLVLLPIGIAYQLYLTPPELLTQPVYIVIGGILAITSIMGYTAYKAVQTVRKKRISLEQQLLSSIGIAKTDIREENPGVVYVLNEEWTAYSVKGVIPAGSRVKIVRIDGLKLYVEKID